MEGDRGLQVLLSAQLVTGGGVGVTIAKHSTMKSGFQINNLFYWLLKEKILLEVIAPLPRVEIHQSCNSDILDFNWPFSDEIQMYWLKKL